LVGDQANRDRNKAVRKFSGRASQQTGTESIFKTPGERQTKIAP
jgi:hypothetical protein